MWNGVRFHQTWWDMKIEDAANDEAATKVGPYMAGFSTVWLCVLARRGRPWSGLCARVRTQWRQQRDSNVRRGAESAPYRDEASVGRSFNSQLSTFKIFAPLPSALNSPRSTLNSHLSPLNFHTLTYQTPTTPNPSLGLLHTTLVDAEFVHELVEGRPTDA